MTQPVKKALKMQFERTNCCLWQDGDSPCQTTSSIDEHKRQEKQTKQTIVK